MKDEKIIKLQHFFEIDVKIKKGMYDMAPSTIEYFDEYAIKNYADAVDDLLIYVFSKLKCVAVDIFGSNSMILQKVCDLEIIIKDKLYSCGYDMDKLKKFYNLYISGMSPEFINSVKSECVGYSLPSGGRALESAASINELLHYIHSLIVNNNDILQMIPLQNQKQNEYSYSISLRGDKAPTFEQLFEQFPLNLDVGDTDMVIINENKLIMMVRDRGHALTIEITLNEDIARLEYFIPKLCNIDMINKLPGINAVNKNSVGATGIIEIPINSLPMTLIDFISKVPMDSDMVFEPSASIRF